MYVAGDCRLRQLLKQRNLSQTELARRLKMKPQQIHNYISGRRVMTLEIAKNIATVLSCEIDDLYEWVERDNNE